MREQRHRAMIGSLPENVPTAWIIFNAPRPIYGHVEWRDGNGFGFFFAAVNPEGERAEWMQYENHRQDACILHFVTEDEAFAQGRARMMERHGEQALNVVDDPKHRQWVINSFIDSINDHGETYVQGQ